MANEIKQFLYGDKPIRTTDRGDQTWFVGSDVCAVLDIKNDRDALAKLDDDERGVASTDTLGGPQDHTIISEAGVYRLVFSSRKPEAEAFKRWLAHEVIPAIRKTGRYEAPRPAARALVPATYASPGKIRHAKMNLVFAIMHLDELGVDAAAIDIAAVVAFARKLSAMGVRQ